MSAGDLLSVALSAAVPLYILELAGTSADDRVILAGQLSQTIASHGDDILFRSSRRGATAAAFDALAKGLAIGAYQPGGVTFAGQHWCTDHAACEAAEREAGGGCSPA